MKVVLENMSGMCVAEVGVSVLSGVYTHKRSCLDSEPLGVSIDGGDNTKKTGQVGTARRGPMCGKLPRTLPPLAASPGLDTLFLD